ncbi:MAG: phosphate acyltransferase PlsX [Anaerolineae bacterium]|nr:phosphate acyltransferase PlsX [Anaerolineae bacterium]
MRIILDAMGSDNHPQPEIQAAVQAAKEFRCEILLVGDENQLADKLAQANPQNAAVRIVHAPEVFEMTTKLSGSMLRKVQNSMGVCMDLLKSGEGDVVVTAGNTGGAMAIGLARLGRLKGVKRPALSALFPVRGGHCVVLDLGANTDCRPEYLVQFAQMGSVYARQMLKIDRPRVGLVSNGEEAGKGNDLVKATYPLLQATGLNFIGNIEGKELFGGEADVAVADGFTGNVLLKASEAVAKFMTDILKEELMATARTKVGALLAKPAFDTLKRTLDPDEVGGVPLLGINGLVFVGHGRSDARALVNGMRWAKQAVEGDLLGALRAVMEGK